jgi:hypothetical protein
VSGVQQLETHFCVIAKEKGRRRAHASVKKKNFCSKVLFFKKNKNNFVFSFFLPDARESVCCCRIKQQQHPHHTNRTG